MRIIAPRSSLGALTVLFAAIALAGCAPRSGSAKRPSAPPAPAYPYSAEAARTFYAASDGLKESPPAAGEGVLASRAPNASVLSSDGRTIVAAVNGWGVARIETNAGARMEAAPVGAVGGTGARYRIVGTPLPSSFAGLSTGGAWPLGGGFLVQLFRDPFSQDSGAPASRMVPAPPVSAARLAFFDAKSGAATALDPTPSGLDPGFELFALLPASGRWFAELRKDGATRVDLKFLAFGDPLAGRTTTGPSASSEIGRPEFEAALRPKSLASLSGSEGEGLRVVLRALGSGPYLVRLRSSSGEDGWYLSGGRPEEATSIYAWFESDSGTLLALRSDGALASSDDQGKTVYKPLLAPVPGAAFTALTAAGGIAAAAWESGEFPLIDQAGLVIAPLPR
jgi:hypothetical protein